MTLAEIRAFRRELLDAVHEQASEPVPELESIKGVVDEFTGRLEVELNGTKEE
jgi:hypothetical protein